VDLKGFRNLAVIGWISISAFLPLLLAFADQKILPLILELILLALFVLFLRRLNPFLSSSQVQSS
jgi:hypothetical protein